MPWRVLYLNIIEFFIIRDEPKMKRLALATLLIPVLLAACSEDKKPAEPAVVALPPPDAAAGRKVAERLCVSCHGFDGLSTAPDIPHIAGQKPEYLFTAMREYITGAREHAALQALQSKLNETDERDVAAYYATQKPALPKPVDPQANKQQKSALATGMELTAACAGCHGPDGNGMVPGMPSLAGMAPAYLAAALGAYKKEGGSRADGVMAEFVTALDKAKMESIALYYAIQKPKSRGPAPFGDPAAGEPLSGGCGGCHGQKGVSADPKTPSLAGQDAVYFMKAVKAYRDGGRKHETMKGLVAALSDGDIQHLAAFYAAQDPKGVEVSMPLTAEEWAERCDRCHNSDAASPAIVVPVLNAQREEYLVRALSAYRDGKRKHSTMHVMGAPLTDSEIQAISAYYAARPR
jgi:cytochrome c553